MKTIGIIGAMEEEIIYLQEKIEVVTTKSVIGLSFDIGRYMGNNIVLVKSGIGKVNAAVCTQAMIDHFGVDYVINIGVAGALSEELHIGDILISTDAVQHDMDTSALGDAVGEIPRMPESYFKADETMVHLAQEAGAEMADGYQVLLGRVASGDQFVSTKEAKEKIRRNVKGDCAEMEGAAIAHACWLNRIPFVILRAISDDAGEEAGMSFEQFCKMAAKRSSDLVEKMLEKM
ncbi:MAG: 5'-methylthioadenosine/adenosylhomocysteine nucleosidase [Anaerotignum sp.]|nr:5'-methylthioadenosine/adenosylhomocysteine nucleosidase [Anaerotignum sp.]